MVKLQLGDYDDGPDFDDETAEYNQWWTTKYYNHTVQYILEFRKVLQGYRYFPIAEL